MIEGYVRKPKFRQKFPIIIGIAIRRSKFDDFEGSIEAVNAIVRII
jgi:hypothetical protein